jgi:alpha-beta hydrolase superfamily lysophospholipase
MHNNSKNAVLLFPGFTEHRTSLEDVAKKLYNNNFSTFYFDINSQGESLGEFSVRGIARSVFMLAHEIKKKYNFKKIGLFGNSLGAMSCAYAVKEDLPVEGLFLSSCPNSINDFLSEFNASLLKKAPKPLINTYLKINDIKNTIKSKNYRNKTHKLIKENKQMYYGALKITNHKVLFSQIMSSPKSETYFNKINVPTFMLYGGNDKCLGITKSKLPPNLDKLFNQLNIKNSERKVIENADHSMNKKTHADDKYNSSIEFSFVKDEICNFFKKYLEN